MTDTEGTGRRKKRRTAGFTEEDLQRPPERTIVLVPVLAQKREGEGGSPPRSEEARLEEAIGLVQNFVPGVTHCCRSRAWLIVCEDIGTLPNGAQLLLAETFQ